MSKKIKIPLLPLPNIVMFPCTSLPFLIVEPTYAQLVKSICEKGELIAVSWAQEQSRWDGKIKHAPKMVCTAAKPVLLEEPDGGIKVMMHGQFRIKLTQIRQNLPTPIYEAYPLIDQQEDIVLPQDIIQRLSEILNQWIKDTVTDSLEREHFLNSLTTVHHIVDNICLFVIRDKQTRQLLLETCSLRERLCMLNGLLRGEFPLCEDALVREALKNFEKLERLDQVGH